jgi:hypothetical protein
VNKDIKDSMISNKSSRDIMKNYFGVPLNKMVEILEDMEDVELKYEVERYRKELQVDFIVDL